MPNNAPSPIERQAAEAWRLKLLPLMMAVLAAAGIFFAVMSVFELRSFYARVEQRPLDLSPVFAAHEARTASAPAQDFEYLRWKTSVLLEADTLKRRYEQANNSVLARVWTRQLGFITGMLLALVGAAFVLGRLQEEATRVEAEVPSAKAKMVSSSPGLILAAFGTLLMGITLTQEFRIETFDRPVYVNPPTSGAMAVAGPATSVIDSTSAARQKVQSELEREGVQNPNPAAAPLEPKPVSRTKAPPTEATASNTPPAEKRNAR
jgi:hypothetical protein